MTEMHKNHPGMSHPAAAPVPLYMGMEMMNFMTSAAAWQFWKSDLLNWKKDLHPQAVKIREKLLENPLAESQLSLAAGKKFADFLTGLANYHSYQFTKRQIEKPVIWQQGTTRVFDYCSMECDPQKPLVIFIPSLINRSYILDLNEERSILKFLAAQGFHPVLVDWDEPGKMENNFSVNDYIARVASIVDFMKRKINKPVIVAGYCMGGMIAAALAQLMPKDIAGLILLAAPWDFHSKDTERVRLDKTHLPIIENMLRAGNQLSGMLVQGIFYTMHPWAIHDKFRNFGRLNMESKEADEFVHIENWVNDGIALTQKVARECLIDWAYNNQPMQGGWKINGMCIDPAKIALKSFIAIPQHDKIVPPLCAEALSKLIRHKTVVRPDSGHISMVVGKRAAKELWNPLVKWLNKL